MANTNPNFNVSTLPAYVQENQDVLINGVVFGAKTIDRISIQPGIKTTAEINYLSADPVLQNGKGCDFTPDNTTELTQREIVTALIKVNESFCADTLLGKWAEYLVRIPETQRDTFPFEAYVIRIFRDAIAEKIEKLIWQGDTTSADPDLKWINGFLALAASATGVVPVTVAAGTTAWNALKQVILALPVSVIRRGNVKIFVSPEFYMGFVLELVEKNFFHYSGPQNSAPEEIVFPGTNIMVAKTDGLSGTKKILATNAENLFYGTDVENAQEQFKVKYEEDTNLIKVAVRWNSGVQIAFPDRVVLATLS